MAPTKSFLNILLSATFTAALLVMSGCSSSSNPVSSGSGSFDQNLVAVWWNAAGTDGTEVTSDGTIYDLTAYNGKIARDTVAMKASTQKITAAANDSGIIVITGKSPTTGKDTTVTNLFKYVLSNSNNTVAITLKDESGTPTTTTYQKSTLGADAGSGSTGGANTLTVTFGGTQYSFATVTTTTHLDTIQIIAGGTTAECQINFINHVGSETVDGFKFVIFVLGTEEYFSISGSINVTVASSTNSQGTFDVTMVNFSNSSDRKAATGSFNVTHN